MFATSLVATGSHGAMEIEILVNGEPGWLFPECGPAGVFDEICSLVAFGDGWSLLDCSTLGSAAVPECQGLALGSAFLFSKEDPSPMSVVLTVRLDAAALKADALEVTLSAAAGWMTGAEGGTLFPASQLPFLGVALEGSTLLAMPLAGPVAHSGYGNSALPLSPQAGPTWTLADPGKSIELVFAFEAVGSGWVSATSVCAVCSVASPDLNGDGSVDGDDLGRLLSHWGTVDEDGDADAADLDRSGVVDEADLGRLLACWQ